MSCCDPIDFIDAEYAPISQRLSAYGKEVYGVSAMTEYPDTKMWIFSFIDSSQVCSECLDPIHEFHEWFNKYGLFTNHSSHVKWVIEGEPSTNMLWRDLKLSNTPLHVFCDGNGAIWELFYGYPSEQWLDMFVLPKVNT